MQVKDEHGAEENCGHADGDRGNANQLNHFGISLTFNEDPAVCIQRLIKTHKTCLTIPKRLVYADFLLPANLQAGRCARPTHKGGL